jgi:DNA-binding transcriptional ArsR family regulator
VQTDVVIDLPALRSAADSACRLMKVFSNPDRLLLLCQLSQGERRVGELQELVGIGQPTLSQQLGVLREEGLVATRREGKQIHYRIASPQALAVLQVLYQQFCEQPKGSSSC